jgi:putative serine protease PepD
MSQTPTPDSPQQPEPSQQQPTQPLWYGEPSRQQASYPGAGAPSYPPDPSAASHQQSSPWGPGGTGAGGAGTAVEARPRRRRWTEIGSVAALAAVLASGTTYAVTHGDVTADTASAPTAATSRLTETAPVAQANPQAPNWSATAAAVSPSVVSIAVKSQEGGAQGSGVIIDGKGRVVTNNHVVTGAGGQSQLSVTLTDGRTYSASVVGTDPSTDLAVIQMQNAPSDLVPMRTGNADTLKVGDPVMAVGNPLGLAGTVTTGIVSALNRPVTTSQEESPSQDPFGQNQQQGEPVVTNAIQTSAAINPGNSGGALVNASGQLVGINSSIASVGSSDTGGQSGNIGIGFAIPVNEVTSIADQLIAGGKAEHAYLGVSTQDDSVKDGSAERAAASVTAVVGGTPAAKAGLKRGDAIIAVDGEPVDSGLSLVAQVRERGVGDTAKLTIVRNGQRQDIQVTLASKPSSNR